LSLSAITLQTALAPRQAWYYEQVESTQDVALEWLRNGAEAGAVVIADEQLKGRGRRNRDWQTPPGTALALSVILRPQPGAISQVTMLGALAVAELLEGLGADGVTIKWPNDVRLNGRKVSGVLPEAAWEGERLLGVVLGVGLNVRVDFTGTSLESVAVSIEPALGIHCNRTELVATLLRRVDYWSRLLGSGELFDAWKARLETVGQYVRVATDEGAITGLAQSVDERGVLLICDDAGEIRRVVAGDVTLA
jgi:BirA family transcriptional regulator, biotin operon repressor / biotin---[acetyl-CoA-carboxylase] ligase